MEPNRRIVAKLCLQGRLDDDSNIGAHEMHKRRGSLREDPSVVAGCALAHVETRLSARTDALCEPHVERRATIHAIESWARRSRHALLSLRARTRANRARRRARCRSQRASSVARCRCHCARRARRAWSSTPCVCLRAPMMGLVLPHQTCCRPPHRCSAVSRRRRCDRGQRDFRPVARERERRRRRERALGCGRRRHASE